jgi:hypothetical protein
MTMADLIKIGHTFLNLDRVLAVEDQFADGKGDRVVIRFGMAEAEALTFTGRDADDLRTWLNSRAVNLRDASSNES